MLEIVGTSLHEMYVTSFRAMFSDAETGIVRLKNALPRSWFDFAAFLEQRMIAL